MENRDKIIIDIKPLKDKDIIFCTECGEELNEFYLSAACGNIEDLKKRHENCKRTGKFQGDTCAMLFIADSSDIDLPESEE
ncbi:MAG: hypothetical protein V1720_05585 [bacterium]